MEDNKFSIQVTINIDGSTTIKKVKMESFVIGRHADCEVNVLHPQVSRQHLRVSVIDNKIYCEDIGSSNGTFKDSVKIEHKKSFVLEPNDILMLGDGPTIQIQFEDKKPNTVTSTLSKIESFISPLIPSKANTPPTPKVIPVAVAPVKEIPQIPDFAVPGAKHEAKPESSAPSVIKDLKESDKTIQEANKQAAQILQKAEMEAEAKAQAAYKHAMETEQRAEKTYQERLLEANKEAEKVYQATRQENQKLLQEARTSAEALRKQAEEDTRLLRKTTEEKCAEFLKQAEKQAEDLKSKRLSEADSIIDKKAQDLLKSTQELIEKQKSEALNNLDSLKAQTSRTREQKVNFEKEVDQLEKSISDLKNQVKHNKESAEASKVQFDKMVAAEKEMAARLEKFKKETLEHEKNHQKYKIDIEKYMIDLASLKETKEHTQKEMASHFQALKEKMEQEKEVLNKKEEERLNQLKLDTAENIKKYERQLLEEVITRKSKIAKEILLQIEAKFSFIGTNDEWKYKLPELEQTIQEIISDSNQEITKKSLDGKTPRFALYKKEKVVSMMFGVFMGVLLIAGIQKFSARMNGNSPLERMVASAVDAKKMDLENRRYNPPQTPGVKSNYVDSVIFTEKFSEIYSDPAFQEAWTKAATKYLYKTWRLDEDHSAKALAITAALVKDLAERKQNIHPDFVKKGLDQMRAVEMETIPRLKTELGGEVRLESFKKYEKIFFEKYDRVPANSP